MSANADIHQLVTTVDALGNSEHRVIVAIAGAPGAGKSTLASALQRLLQEARNETVPIVPMDGFHLDNAALEARGHLARKGAPFTFDVAGYLDILEQVRGGTGDVFAPAFDRDNDATRPDAICIGADARIVLTEGNYLLLNADPWRAAHHYFNFTVYLSVGLAELERRLRARWHDLGLPAAEVARKVERNDLVNARLVVGNSVPADLSIAVS